MSRSISINFLNTNGTTLTVNNLSLPIKIIIPRDTSLILPSMTFENISQQTLPTSNNKNNNRQFSLYYVNITSPTESLTISATFEFKSDNSSLGFMIIFRFDAIPILNSSMNQTDGYKVFCPTGK
jgi:hypothetical protein